MTQIDLHVSNNFDALAPVLVPKASGDPIVFKMLISMIEKQLKRPGVELAIILTGLLSNSESLKV